MLTKPFIKVALAGLLLASAPLLGSSDLNFKPGHVPAAEAAAATVANPDQPSQPLTQPGQTSQPAVLLDPTVVADTPQSEDGTSAQQLAVRILRDVAGLPLKQACTVDPNRELFIRDLSVVNDCTRTTWGPCVGPAPVAPATRGAWTVGGLLPGIFGVPNNNPANAALLSRLTLQWLRQWNVLQTVNGDPVPARPNMETLVIQPWLAASGGTQLDLTKAPFRLLAIVARLDLRQGGGASGGPYGIAPGVTAGEGRFVFNLLDANGNITQFLLILEYGLDAKTCTDILNWAQIWHALGSIPFGPNYNAALQQITDKFSTVNASPGKPNGSAINQVRTDEIFLAPTWELREFHLTPSAGLPPVPLLEATVAQTPQIALQLTAPITNFVAGNLPSILNNSYTVPLVFGAPAVNFRGGKAPNTLAENWDGNPTLCAGGAGGNAGGRATFSLNTCNGCHGPETNTVFKQVQPRAANAVAQLSGFLTGEPPVTDICGLVHNFNDINRRRVDLCQLLNRSCSQVTAEPPIGFVH